MALEDKLQEDLKQAMRDKDVTKRQTLRMVLSAAKNLRIEKGEDLSEKELLAVIAKEVKKRKDSDEQYTKAGREDLAVVERAEIVVLMGYMPKQLSEEEAKVVVEGIIQKLGLTEKKQMGQVMKAIMADYKDQVDGKTVQRLASALLS